MKKTKIIVNIPIYNEAVVFYLGDIYKLKNFVEKDFMIEFDDGFRNADGVTYNIEKDYGIAGTIIVAVDNFWKKNLIYSLGVLSHELIHASMMLILNRGMKVDEINDENLAYIHQYILTNFLKKINLQGMIKTDAVQS